MIGDGIRHLAADSIRQRVATASSASTAQGSPGASSQSSASASTPSAGSDSTGSQPAASRWTKDGHQRRGTAILQALGRKIDPLDKGQIKQAATQMAATLFFQPLLQEMRKMQGGAKFAHGGRGEDVFGEQLDVRLADTIAASNPGGITARIAAKVEKAAQNLHSAKDAGRPTSWATSLQAARKN